MDFAVATLQDVGRYTSAVVMTADTHEDWRLLEYYAVTNTFDGHYLWILTPWTYVPEFVKEFAFTKDVAPQQQNGTDVNMSLSTV